MGAKWFLAAQEIREVPSPLKCHGKRSRQEDMDNEERSVRSKQRKCSSGQSQTAQVSGQSDANAVQDQSSCPRQLSTEDLFKSIDLADEGKCNDLIDALFERYDRDGNGLLEGEEEVKELVDEATEYVAEKLELHFKDIRFAHVFIDKEKIRKKVRDVMDPNCDGKITKAELKSSVKQILDASDQSSVEQKGQGSLPGGLTRKALFKKIDLAEKGQCDEFIASLFKMYDNDASGQLQGKEVQNLVDGVTSYVTEKFELHFKDVRFGQMVCDKQRIQKWIQDRMDLSPGKVVTEDMLKLCLKQIVDANDPVGS